MEKSVAGRQINYHRRGVATSGLHRKKFIADFERYRTQSSVAGKNFEAHDKQITREMFQFL